MTPKSVLIGSALVIQPEINEHHTKMEKQNIYRTKKGQQNTPYDDGKSKVKTNKNVKITLTYYYEKEKIIWRSDSRPKLTVNHLSDRLRRIWRGDFRPKLILNHPSPID
jgi:hypothetical protein